jgi:hypothetical protein
MLKLKMSSYYLSSRLFSVCAGRGDGPPTGPVSKLLPGAMLIDRRLADTGRPSKSARRTAVRTQM